MPIRPFCFVHASDLHLERPPGGIEEVPDHLRPLFVDAAYRAAERVFETAITVGADFLLLVGDVVDPDLSGPRGCVFLAEQCSRLAQKNIRVYWAGGRADHHDVWPPGLDLPANVHLFPHGQVGRVEHLRDGEPLALVLGSSRRERKRFRPAEFIADEGSPFTVAAVYGLADGESLAGRSVQYWALGGEHERRSPITSPVTAHYPGTPQGRRPREAGPRGCTSVHVDEAGRVRTSFVATDALRWINERILVTPHTGRDQLERQLRERAAALWGAGLGPDMLVTWTVAGSPWLAAKLRWGTLENDLLTRLRQEFGNRRPGMWSVSIQPEGETEIPESWFTQESLLGEMLRSLQKLSASDTPPDLRALLEERQAAGALGEAVSLADPDAKRRAFDEAALLAVELLGHQESPT